MDIKRANNLHVGRRSEIVQSFLKEHGLDKIELPSTGSLVTDMKLKLAIWLEKKEAMDIAMDIIKNSDSRALSWFNQLTNLTIQLSSLERDLVSEGINPLMSDQYVRAQALISEIRKHYDRMQFDLEKTRIERNIKKNSRNEEDVMFDVYTNS